MFHSSDSLLSLWALSSFQKMGSLNKSKEAVFEIGVFSISPLISIAMSQSINSLKILEISEGNILPSL